MTAYIAYQPSDYYSTLLYTGTTLAQSVTGVGFTQDVSWIKCRDGAENNALYDTVRGATKTLRTNNTAAETTDLDGLTAFDSDGFTTGAGNGEVNDNAKLYVAWNWKMGTTTGVDFSAGDITPSSYSIDATRGMGIYAYTGTGSAGTIAHGLGQTPRWLIIKSRNLVEFWPDFLTHDSVYFDKYWKLDTTATYSEDSTMWNSTRMTDTLVSLGTHNAVNDTSDTYIMYLFCDVPGFSKGGYYQGNGLSTGPNIYTGFRPAFVMIKRKNGTGNWAMADDKRGYNGAIGNLVADADAVESTADNIDIVSNGFTIRANNTERNGDGEKYQWLAFAEFPIVSSNSVPGVAR